MKIETRIVNGQEVIATERVPSFLPKRNGHPQVYFSSVEKLLLADDSVVYGCTTCDYTAEKAGQVRFHHGTEHKGRKMGHPKGPRKTEPEIVPVTEPEIDPEDSIDDDDLLAAFEAALTGGGSEKVEQLEKEIAALKREVENLTTERDWWKEEARKAIGRLARLRNALRGVVKDEK